MNGSCVAAMFTCNTSPGAMSTGTVGPSSVPFDRCTSTLTRVRTPLVVFSTVPLNELLGG